MKIEKEILYRYFSNRATEEEEKAVRKYIEESPENWKEYLRERKLFDAFIVKPRSVKTALWAEPASNVRRLFRECAKIAAVFLVAFSVSYFYIQKTNGEVACSVVSTRNRQMAQVELPDGTQVSLNANTRLEYPTRFADKKREVRVDGEAYFEVAHNEEKPFVVHTSRSEVEVLGTKFYVEDYADSEVSATSLMEGSVEVTSGGTRLRLQPNQKATLADGRMVVSTIADLDVYRWREGLICLKNKTVPEVMDIFEKYYGVQFTYPHDREFKNLISGKFRISDGVEHALKVLQRNVSFTYVRDEENNRIELR